MTTTFKDRLGRTIKVGDRVAYASFHNLGLTLGTVTKLGRVNVEVTPPKTAFNPRPETFRPADVIKA